MYRFIFKYCNVFNRIRTISLICYISCIHTGYGSETNDLVFHPLNTAPEITIPNPQVVYENGTLIFNAASNNSIVLTDDDNDNQTINLSVSLGRITLSQTTGLTFIDGTSNASSSLHFQGNITDINTALEGAYYEPQNNRGSFEILITTDDGHSGQAVKSLTVQSVISLSPGDLAFTGFNADGDDGFAFVLLKAVDGSTQPVAIEFTDKVWNGSVFSPSEGTIQWTVTSDLSAGTVVAFHDITGSKTASHGTIETSGSVSLSGSNENLFAFVGTLEQPLAFLAAFSNDGDDGWGTLNGTGLTKGLNALDIGDKDRDADIATYIGGRNTETNFDGYLPSIMDLSHWVTQDGTGDQSNDGIDPDLPFDITPFSIDNSPPTLIASTPATNRQGFNLGTPILLTFSKTVVKGTGKIKVMKSIDHTLIETIDVSSAAVSIQGNTATIQRHIALEQANSYYVTIDPGTFQDALGNTYTGITNTTSLHFSTANVVVNEIVTDPEQDWSTNDFNGVDGRGAISQGTDEYVELFIKTSGVDLTGWTIELIDGTDVIGDLTSNGAFAVSNYLSGQGGSFTSSATGDYLVLGNVDGSGAMNNDVLIILKDPSGTMVDRVKLGGGTGEGPNGQADGIFDEAIQRKPNGTDTNQDDMDFVKVAATMGKATDDIPPTLSAASKNNDTQITLTFNEPIRSEEGNPTDFSVIDCRGNSYEVTNQKLDLGNDQQLLLTLTSLANSIGELTITYTNRNDEITDFGGNALVTDDTGVTITGSSDHTPPTLEQAVSNGDTEIILSFSESVTAFQANPNDFKVTDGLGRAYRVHAITDGTLGDDQIALTVADFSEAVGDITITYTNQNNEIADLNCNALATDAIGLSIDRDDQAPQMVRATKDSDTQITITFNELVQTQGTNPSDFQVVDGNDKNFNVTAQEDHIAQDHQIVLTVENLSTAQLQLIITYTNNHNEITDFGGNALATDTEGVTISLNAPPEASNVTFSGNLVLGEQLTGIYGFSDANGDPERGSSFQWYRAEDMTGTKLMAISGANQNTYTLVAEDALKFIRFEVTPNDGSNAGLTASSEWLGPIKQLQSITFNSLPHKTYGEDSFSLNASSDAGLPIQYTSSDPEVAMIANDNKVSIINAGNTIITATQAGSNHFIAAEAVQQSLTIHKASLSVTAENKARIYGEENPELTFTYAGFQNDEKESVLDIKPTISTTATTTTDVGTAPITLAGGNDKNYDLVLNKGTLTIDKALLTVTAEDKTRVYGEENPELTFTYAGFQNGEDESVLDVKPTISTTATTTTNVGTADITLSGGSDKNYKFVLNKGELTIGKAALTITAEDKARIYGEENPELTFTYAGFQNDEEESVLDVKPTISTTATTTTDVGTADITLSDGSDKNYKFVLNKGELSIGKAALTITAEDKARIYGEENPELTFTYAGFQNDEEESVLDVKPTISTTATTTTNVGTADITLSGGSDKNYKFVLNKGELTIGKATLTITAENKARIYGEENPELTFTYAGFQNDEEESVLDVKPTISTTATTTTNVGTADITLSGGSDKNYKFVLNKGELTIGKATLTITAENKARIYGEENPELTFTYAGFQNGEDESVLDVKPTISTTATTTTDVGTADITLSDGSDKNYKFVLNKGELTIGKAALTITAEDKARIYGEENPELTFTYAGFQNDEEESVLDVKPTISTTATTTTNVGTADITLSGGSDKNYKFVLNKGELTIGKATLTITAEDKARIYGEENPELTFTYAGFQNDEEESVLDVKPTISTTATTTTDVGTADITLSDGSDKNYKFVLNKGELSIGKAALTITAEDKARIYGEENPELTFTYAGFQNGEDESVLDVKPTISTTATTTTDVGTADITLSDGSDKNYKFVLNKGELSIGKAALTITAENKARIYGEENPELTFTYAGFQNDEEESVLDVKPTISTTATTTTDVGTADITLSDGSDKNYKFVLNKGELSIGKAALTITAEDKARIYGEENPELTFTYAGFQNGEEESVLDVKPTISTTATETTEVGTAPITLAGGNDNNYNFVFNKGTLSITKTQLISQAKDTSRNFGEDNPVFEIQFSGFKNDESPAVFEVVPKASSPAQKMDPPGTYPIEVLGGSAKNYTFERINGTLTILPPVPPQIESITRAETDQVQNDKRTVSFRVAFSKKVNGLQISSFTTILTGSATGIVNAISTSNRVDWLVSLIGITGQGTVGIRLQEQHKIQDDAGQDLESSDFPNDFYTINWIPTNLNLSRTSIDENNGVGEIIGNLSTEDKDASDRHTYHLVSGMGSNDNGSFQILGNELQAKTTFDYEEQHQLSVRIATDDGNGGVLAKVFRIDVNNVIEPNVAIVGDSLFQKVPIGLSQEKEWKVINTGEKSLALTTASLPEYFRIEPETFHLPLGDTTTVQVIFEPESVDTIQGNIILAYDDEFFRKTVRGESAIITSIASGSPHHETFRLFPNPAQNHITITFPSSLSPQSIIQIYHQDGHSIFKTTTSEHRIQIPVNHWPNGVYLLEWKTKNNLERQKFWIVR